VSLSKLGPHDLRGLPVGLLWASRAPIVKSVGSTAAIRAAPEHALRVYRWPWSEVEQDRILKLIDAAEVIGRLLGGLAGYRHPRLHVELLNEVHRDRSPEYRALALKAVPLLRAQGLKVALPSWSTGSYEQEDWDGWRAIGWAGADAIALHAYWGDQGFSPWHALRYERFWEPGDPPVIVSECGRDAVEGGRGGWRADGLTDERYLRDLVAYDAALARDPYVHGACVFTSSPSPDWANYDIDPLCQRLADLSGPIPAPAPTPEGPPMTTRTNPWRGKILMVWNLPADPATLIGWADRLGLDGFDIKVGDGDSPWGASRLVTKGYVDALRTGGRRVTGWTYNYCDLRRNAGDRGDGVPEAEADAAAERVRSLGLDGHTFDLEIESEGHADLVEIMLSRFRAALPAAPLAVHTWADRTGHETYAWDAIKRHADVLRPMIYRPHWNAAGSWRELGDWYAGSVVCPVLGLTEGTAPQIRADHDFALLEGCPGVGLWEYGALPGARGVEDLVRSWSFDWLVPPAEPAGVPPSPELAVAELALVTGLRDRTWDLASEWGAQGYPVVEQAIKAVVMLHKGER
jgi:hypothetical protein